jgi:hypothetical protein
MCDGFDWIQLARYCVSLAGSESGNEYLGSIKGGEFVAQLSQYWLLKMNSDPWSYLSLSEKYSKSDFILINSLKSI